MAKKKKKKPTGPAQPNRQELKQQRLEARRQAKAEAEIRRQRAAKRERLVRYLMLALLGAGAFWFVFLRNNAPTEINGHPIQSFSSRGAGDHVSGDVQYQSSPPVSGEHAPGPAACGVYGAAVPEENQVHNLEHGAVAIQYQPTLEIDKIRQLEAFAEEFDTHILVAPFPQMETPIAVTSWSRLMPLDDVDEEAIHLYIEEFRGKGPEPNQPCDNVQDSPFQEPEEEAPRSEVEVGGEPAEATEAPEAEGEGSPSP